MTILATLTHIIVDDKILLIRKKRGFGRGFYNGPGGKIECGENVYEAAVREVEEEIGIVVKDIKPIGVLIFFFGKKEIPDWIVYVFKSNFFEGEPVSSEEAEPTWFNISKIPYDQMWGDDRVWLPLLLNDVNFMSVFLFDQDAKNIVRWIARSLSPEEIDVIFKNYKKILEDPILKLIL